MSSKTFVEGNYSFDFEKSMNAIIADKPAYNGISRVDFIVELDDKYIFVEIKDFDHEKTDAKRKNSFLEDLKISKDNPVLSKMGAKFKDTILYNWAKNNFFLKPIEFVIVLQFKDATADLKGRLR